MAFARSGMIRGAVLVFPRSEFMIPRSDLAFPGSVGALSGLGWWVHRGRMCEIRGRVVLYPGWGIGHTGVGCEESRGRVVLYPGWGGGHTGVGCEGIRGRLVLYPGWGGGHSMPGCRANLGWGAEYPGRDDAHSSVLSSGSPTHSPQRPRRTQGAQRLTPCFPISARFVPLR